MRVLIDTNIFLDAFLDRKPFSDDARTLFEMIESGEVQGYVSATTVTDIFYISKKAKGTLIAKQAIIRILTTLEVCAVNRKILEAAIASNSDDFEDAVQLACAVSEGLDAIVTQNMQGFLDASIDILTAGELLTRLSSET
ncbi:MAG: PIN domain-containing protein [Limnoraphis sp. WC205]|jgi:predicted nucleic acid-binding protein|nr:PIN domain-containing protein [Limnoraphis sp. WC205]